MDNLFWEVGFQGAEIKPSTIDGIGPILKCGPTLKLFFVRKSALCQNDGFLIVMHLDLRFGNEGRTDDESQIDLFLLPDKIEVII